MNEQVRQLYYLILSEKKSKPSIDSVKKAVEPWKPLEIDTLYYSYYARLGGGGWVPIGGSLFRMPGIF